MSYNYSHNCSIPQNEFLSSIHKAQQLSWYNQISAIYCLCCFAQQKYFERFHVNMLAIASYVNLFVQTVFDIIWYRYLVYVNILLYTYIWQYMHVYLCACVQFTTSFDVANVIGTLFVYICVYRYWCIDNKTDILFGKCYSSLSC